MPATVQQDRTGIDYFARLRGGAALKVDVKSRQAGARRWWKEGPELALEDWSVIPGGKYSTPRDRAKIGWTINEASATDLVLYTFNPSDCNDVFLLPFQHLRIAAQTYARRWLRWYEWKLQDSQRWESSALFVPVPVVLDAIRDISIRKRP